VKRSRIVGPTKMSLDPYKHPQILPGGLPLVETSQTGFRMFRCGNVSKFPFVYVRNLIGKQQKVREILCPFYREDGNCPHQEQCGEEKRCPFAGKGEYKISLIGEGDMELGLFMGLLLGWKFLILALFLSYFFGLLIATPLLVMHKANRRTKLPMGAFLMPATILFLYNGEALWEWYMSFLGL
jgi:prepilin signal peptidase PulO-like enzyme (type II secretory pathway)